MPPSNGSFVLASITEFDALNILIAYFCTRFKNRSPKRKLMKRIAEFKKQFNVTPDTDLSVLKKTYRGLIKEWHPDKFRDDDEKASEAEANSTKIIEGYHFLVSISPETHEANLDQYTTTTTSSGIDDFILEKQVLKVTFKDGSEYEYFGVPNKVYLKMINSATQYRFGKRHIFNSYTFRNIKKRTEAA